MDENARRNRAHAAEYILKHLYQTKSLTEALLNLCEFNEENVTEFVEQYKDGTLWNAIGEGKN